MAGGEQCGRFEADLRLTMADEKVDTNQPPKRRPSGLCAGEFVVPDDFVDPLPESILNTFEGTTERLR